jgi:HPt (histidine-containing phosphotransfer) domain-containing protein
MALLDLRQLETFTIIGYDEYLELYADLLQEVPLQLEQIRAAIQQDDTLERKNIAHALRGILAYFGCAAMSARLAELEVPATVTPPDQATAIHTELLALWETSLAAIQHWEKSVPGFAP